MKRLKKKSKYLQKPKQLGSIQVYINIVVREHSLKEIQMSFTQLKTEEN